MIVTTTNGAAAPGVTVLHVAGEVDTFAADELREQLRRLPLGADGAVVVDLSAVTFMSCAALSVLAEAQARLGSRPLLGRRSRVVARLLELTHLTPSFARRAGNCAGPGTDGRTATADGGAPRILETTAPRAWTFSRADVDRVRGLLMAIHGCDADEAWRILALAAARHGVPVGELAQLLIRAHGEAPSPAAAEAALTVLMRTPLEVSRAADEPDPGAERLTGR